jgi:hypothetical protein
LESRADDAEKIEEDELTSEKITDLKPEEEKRRENKCQRTVSSPPSCFILTLCATQNVQYGRGRMRLKGGLVLSFEMMVFDT